ncbi:GNAT family N-acetyltransferase [Streptomyces sp. NPDC001939]
MIITRATESDLPLLLDYRREAAAWLRDQGIGQWNNPFPADHVLASIRSGFVFLVKDGSTTAATVTLDAEPEPGLWTDEELRTPSMHLHKLIVRRDFAGEDLGSRILDWSCDRAAKADAVWVRINVNTLNYGLQKYYLRRGYEYVRTVNGGGVGGAGVAGWLAQRRAARHSEHGLQEQFADRDTA